MEPGFRLQREGKILTNYLQCQTDLKDIFCARMTISIEKFDFTFWGKLHAVRDRWVAYAGDRSGSYVAVT